MPLECTILYRRDFSSYIFARISFFVPFWTHSLTSSYWKWNMPFRLTFNITLDFFLSYMTNLPLGHYHNIREGHAFFLKFCLWPPKYYPESQTSSLLHHLCKNSADLYHQRHFIAYLLYLGGPCLIPTLSHPCLLFIAILWITVSLHRSFFCWW